MVYDVVHATPEDPGNHCGPGAAHGCRCGPGSIECTELGGFPHVDHDNTLLSGARVWRLRTCSRQRKPSQRFAVYRTGRLEPQVARLSQLWRASGIHPWLNPVALLLSISL